MADQAQKCIQALDSKRQDITMLWYLKKPEWLNNFKVGRELLDWAENIMEVKTRESTSPEFQAEVTREFKLRGIRAVAPERVVANWQKDKVKELCLTAKWPKPFFPVMLQTRPGATQTGCGAFVMFSSWQDAMIALKLMARTKRYKAAERSYPAEMVFENQIADMGEYDIPCRLILDCDAKVSDFGGDYDLEKLQKSIRRVPIWFARRLVEIGAIKDTDRLVVYVKQKLREDKGSQHVVFNVVGRSTWELQAVLKDIFDAEQEKLEKEEKLIAEGRKRKADVLEPWRVVDRVPHHGRGQYSVLGFFDKKKGETQNPTLCRRLVIVNGAIVPDDKMGGKVSRTECTPDHPGFLKLLHRACYTCPVEDFVTINPKFMRQKQVG